MRMTASEVIEMYNNESVSDFCTPLNSSRYVETQPGFYRDKLFFTEVGAKIYKNKELIATCNRAPALPKVINCVYRISEREGYGERLRVREEWFHKIGEILLMHDLDFILKPAKMEDGGEYFCVRNYYNSHNCSSAGAIEYYEGDKCLVGQTTRSKSIRVVDRHEIILFVNNISARESVMGLLLENTFRIALTCLTMKSPTHAIEMRIDDKLMQTETINPGWTGGENYILKFGQPSNIQHVVACCYVSSHCYNQTLHIVTNVETTGSEPVNDGQHQASDTRVPAREEGQRPSIADFINGTIITVMGLIVVVICLVLISMRLN